MRPVTLDGRTLGTVAIALIGAGGCTDLPCSFQQDCPVGFFCNQAEGACSFECLSANDCPEPDTPNLRPICSNQGRCVVEPRSPRVVIREPFEGQVFPPGTESLRVSGRAETTAERLQIEVEAVGRGACIGRVLRRDTVSNPQPGRRSDVVFLIDDVPLPPGPADLRVQVRAGVGQQESLIRVSSACEGCPEVRIDQPEPLASVRERILPRLEGQVAGHQGGDGFWRVTDAQGQVFDGPLPIEPSTGAFRVDDLPLFAGVNAIEVKAPGPVAEGRCAVSVVAPQASEPGLRGVLTWDTDGSDLDLVFVAPDGSLADGRGLLSARFASMEGEVLDDFDGRGPELLRVQPEAPGIYGLAVEALTDGSASGSSALLRLLDAGRLLTVPPLGPRFLSAERGDVWLVGTLEVPEDGGAVRFDSVDRLVSVRSLPSEPPADW
ncbi:MAG TPA: hypothetical protein RMG48_07960 [Myxococcales bacterium LLY-WYZ-16_1]|jgi:hypothetical protein|nr:hypothetical protein [Myxococcales bacterium LLY-WYZ-16_1]